MKKQELVLNNIICGDAVEVLKTFPDESMFTKKDYSDIYERNKFFCRFIKKVIMFNDKMIIIYNGNFNPASEVSIDNNEAFEKQIIEKLKQKKDCPSDNPLNFNEKIPLMTQFVLMGLDGGEIEIIYEY